MEVGDDDDSIMYHLSQVFVSPLFFSCLSSFCEFVTVIFWLGYSQDRKLAKQSMQLLLKFIYVFNMQKFPSQTQHLISYIYIKNPAS
jgi:hypothetical protein